MKIRVTGLTVPGGKKNGGMSWCNVLVQVVLVQLDVPLRKVRSTEGLTRPYHVLASSSISSWWACEAVRWAVFERVPRPDAGRRLVRVPLLGNSR